MLPGLREGIAEGVEFAGSLYGGRGGDGLGFGLGKRLRRGDGLGSEIVAFLGNQRVRAERGGEFQLSFGLGVCGGRKLLAGGGEFLREFGELLTGGDKIGAGGGIGLGERFGGSLGLGRERSDAGAQFVALLGGEGVRAESGVELVLVLGERAAGALGGVLGTGEVGAKGGDLLLGGGELLAQRGELGIGGRGLGARLGLGEGGGGGGDFGDEVVALARRVGLVAESGGEFLLSFGERASGATGGLLRGGRAVGEAGGESGVVGLELPKTGRQTRVAEACSRSVSSSRWALASCWRAAVRSAVGTVCRAAAVASARRRVRFSFSAASWLARDSERARASAERLACAVRSPVEPLAVRSWELAWSREEVAEASWRRLSSSSDCNREIRAELSEYFWLLCASWRRWSSASE